MCWQECGQECRLYVWCLRKALSDANRQAEVVSSYERNNVTPEHGRFHRKNFPTNCYSICIGGALNRDVSFQFVGSHVIYYTICLNESTISNVTTPQLINVKQLRIPHIPGGKSSELGLPNKQTLLQQLQSLVLESWRHGTCKSSLVGQSVAPIPSL